MISRLLHGLVNLIFFIVLTLIITGGFVFDIFDQTVSLRKINTFVWVFLILLIIYRALSKQNNITKIFCFRILDNLSKKLNNYTSVFHAAVMMFLIYSIILSIINCLKVYTLATSDHDTAIFSQAIWNTLNGDILFSSIKGDVVLIADHFNPIMTLLTPLYRLWPSPYALLCFDSVILASGIFPIYWIAKDKTKDPLLTFLFCLAYILYPPLRNVSSYGFHPIALVVPLFLYFFHFLRRDNYVFLVFLMLALMCKESVSVIAFFIGIYMAFFTHHKKTGLVLSVFCVFFFLLIVKVFIPYFNHESSSHYFTKYYGHLGDNLGDVFKAFLFNPFYVIGHIFSDFNLKYYFKIFRSVAFFSILSPSTFLLTVPQLLINALAAKGSFAGHLWGQHSIKLHYTSGLISFVFISAIYGASNIINGKGLFNRVLPSYNRDARVTLVSVILLFSTFLFFGRSEIFNIRKYGELAMSSRIQKIHNNKLFMTILNDKSQVVSVSENLSALFSTRKFIYGYPTGLGKADYVVIRKDMTPKEDREILDKGYTLTGHDKYSDLSIYKKIKSE